MLNPFIQKLGRRFVLSGAEEIALSGASARLRDIQPRTELISEGEVPDHVHLIQKGFAGRYKVLPSGGRSIVAFLIPGDFCDLNVSILGEMDHCIGTISACDVVRIPRSVINDLTEKHPLLNRALQWAGLVDEAILREWLVCMGPSLCRSAGRPPVLRIPDPPPGSRPSNREQLPLPFDPN